MARFYCDICRLWTDDPARPIYHCDKCGLCRVGRGLGIDNWHCPKCDICISLQLRDSHVCSVKGGLKTICPVCRIDELVFYSRDRILLLHCGHGIHLKCFAELMRRPNQVCSLCAEENPALLQNAPRQPNGDGQLSDDERDEMDVSDDDDEVEFLSDEDDDASDADG